MSLLPTSQIPEVTILDVPLESHYTSLYFYIYHAKAFQSEPHRHLLPSDDKYCLVFSLSDIAAESLSAARSSPYGNPLYSSTSSIASMVCSVAESVTHLREPEEC